MVISFSSRRLGAPSSLLLVLAGVLVSFLPWVGEVKVEPELILAGILPPLLYSGAVNIPTALTLQSAGITFDEPAYPEPQSKTFSFNGDKPLLDQLITPDRDLSAVRGVPALLQFGAVPVEGGTGLVGGVVQGLLVVEFLTQRSDLGVDVADEDVLRGPQRLPVQPVAEPCPQTSRQPGAIVRRDPAGFQQYGQLGGQHRIADSSHLERGCDGPDADLGSAYW